MLKMALLAGVTMISAPALAQTVGATPQTAPMQAQAPVTQGQPAPDSMSQSAAPTTTQQPMASNDSTQATAPAASPDQVAQAVSTQFPTYDKDGNGKLSKTEFAAWMTTLKAASSLSGQSSASADKAWADAAFAQADTDKDKSLSKGEVTGFLAQGAS